MSRLVVPDTTSWCSLVVAIVAMAVPTKRPCGAVSSGWTSMVVHSESSPHKDLAISAKTGGGFCCCVMGLPGGVFTLWPETVNELTCRGGGSGLWLAPTMDHYKRTLGMGPSVPTVVLFHGLGGSRWDYLYPVWWHIVAEDFFICECCQQLHGLPQLSHTLCQLAWLAGHGQLGLFHPKL